MRHLLTLLLLLPLLPAPSSSGGTPLELRMVPYGAALWMDDQKTPEVHRQIDRVVADGYNAISIGTAMFMPMYFIDYTQTPYPEAQQYPPAKIKSQLDTLRANIRYAKTKGIRLVVTRSYSFYCPYAFWKAHQAELNPGGIFNRFLTVAHQHDLYEQALKKQGSSAVIPHAQWNNPLYRKFYLYSAEKMLDLIPELDGFLNAYAEAAWTLRTDILKQDTWTNWKDAIDREATDDTFLDYANAIHALLVQKRGPRAFFGLRDWYVKPETLARLAMPRSQLWISVKYSGFDQPLVNYPPWSKDLLDKGYSVMHDILLFDAEHPSPLYWYDNDIIQKIFTNMRAAGFPGICDHDYAAKSNAGDSPDHPLRLLMQKTVAACLAGKPFTDADALAHLRPYYGDGTEPLLRSLKDVARAQEAFIKLNPAWFWRGDGLTSGGAAVARRLWMLKDDPAAPPGMPFVRQDVMSIADYVTQTVAQTAKSARWTPNNPPSPANPPSPNSPPSSIQNPQSKIQNLLTPPQIIAHMRALADDAVTAALDLRARAPKNAPYLRDLVASAYIHQQLVLRDTAFLEAAIHFYRAGATWDGKFNNDKKNATLHPPAPNIDQAAEKAACLEAMQRMIYHDKITAELLRHYAPRRPERRGKGVYPQEKTMSAILGVTLTEPNLDTAEYKRIEQQILATR